MMQRQALSPPAFAREETQALAGLLAWFVITAAWWALALWPVDEAPDWFARTRYVCFGVSESGLPDRGGWIGLIGGPLGMLLILVVGWQDAMRRLIVRARTSRILAATLTALVAGVLLLTVGATMRVLQARTAIVDIIEPETSFAELQRLDREAPPLALISQTGSVIDIANLKDRPVLVTFAYAHCTTVCPLIVTQTLKAQTLLSDTRHEPTILIVTLDPWRDTPSRLPSIAADWALPGENAYVLSGTVEQVEGALDGWNVPRTRDLRNGEVTHPSLVYVIDADGRIAYAAGGGVDVMISLIRGL